MKRQQTSFTRGGHVLFIVLAQISPLWAALPTTWTGATDDAWETPANWDLGPDALGISTGANSGTGHVSANLAW